MNPNNEFEVQIDDDGLTVALHMTVDIAIDLVRAFRRYNRYRITDGINPDSGWEDVAAALEAKIGLSV